MLGCNARPDARGRKTDTGGIAGPHCSGAGGGILPPATGLLSLRVATATQGRPHAAAVVFVRNSRASRATLFALPVCEHLVGMSNSVQSLTDDTRPTDHACTHSRSQAGSLPDQLLEVFCSCRPHGRFGVGSSEHSSTASACWMGLLWAYVARSSMDHNGEGWSNMLELRALVQIAGRRTLPAH